MFIYSPCVLQKFSEKTFDTSGTTERLARRRGGNAPVAVALLRRARRRELALPEAFADAAQLCAAQARTGAAARIPPSKK